MKHQLTATEETCHSISVCEEEKRESAIQKKLLLSQNIKLFLAFLVHFFSFYPRSR